MGAGRYFRAKYNLNNTTKHGGNCGKNTKGVSAPVARSEADFDPGAKYHVPGNTPYTRYFLAALLQFQFHKSLCEIAKDDGPIHRCSIYNSKEAGTALNKMLEMGASKPWQEAIGGLTGTPAMDFKSHAGLFCAR